MKNKWIWILLLLITAAVVWRIWTNKSSDGEAESGGRGGRGSGSAVSVETGLVSIMDISDAGNYSGSLTARSSYIVAPKVAGQLSRLHVNIGQTVSKGQIIAELDDRIYLQELDKAVAAVAIARANAEQTADALLQSEKDLADQRELLAKNFISQNEFNQANSAFVANRSRNNVAKASLQSALAAKNAAEIQLSYTKIKADWHGGSNTRVVGERFADEGAMLSAGAAVVSVLDISSLIAVISVIEKDYTRIKTGQSAVIEADAWPLDKFSGKIARLAPLLQESSRQARVEVEVTNPGQKLKPGMFVRVAITYGTKKNVTAVPSSAIYKYKDKEGVFSVNPADGKASFIAVKKGIVSRDFVEIVSPELSGIVVTLGQDLLEDGKAIALPDKGKPEDKKRGPKG